MTEVQLKDKIRAVKSVGVIFTATAIPLKTVKLIEKLEKLEIINRVE